MRRARPLILLGLLAGCTTPETPWRAALQYEESEVFPIRVGKYGYPYVRAGLNGRSVEVALDTGNMSGLVLSPDVVASLGLVSLGHVQSYGSDGSVRGKVRLFKIDRVAVFGGDWHEQHAVENQGNDVEAYIGPRFLLDRRFTLDYEGRLLAVSKSAIPKDAQGGSALPLVWSSRRPGLLVVRGMANGHSILVELDTGKSRTSVDSALVTRLGLQKAGWRAAWTPGVAIPALQLGPHKFSVPSARVVSFRGISDDLPEPIAIGVGSDILSKLVFTVDYRERVAYFMATKNR